MSGLPVTESSKGYKVPAAFTSTTTERNRLVSWDSTVQGLNKPDGATRGSKSSITVRTLGFVSKITQLFSESIAKLPYALFKFGYEIAKLFTRGISRIRFLFSGSKETS
jgi:hypothetical protein